MEMPVNASVKSLGIDRLPIEERLTLVEEILDSIAADSGAVPLADTQRIELEKRIAEDDANPHDVVPWDQVKRQHFPASGNDLTPFLRKAARFEYDEAASG